MSRRVFLLENAGEHEQHTVINADDKQARSLVESGKGIEVTFGDYDKYRNQAQALHSDYKKKKAKIDAETNPLYTDEVKRYELEKAYAEYEQQAQALQTEWDEKREQMQAEAYAKSARAKIHVAPADKETAEQVANRLTLKVQSAPNALSLAETVGEAENTIKYLSDAEKVALQGQITGLLSTIESRAEKLDARRRVDGKGILSAVQKVDNMDLLASKLADQIPQIVTTEYRTLKAVKRR
ncbi:hypothetical protein [Gracilibacillus thailandensis]|uniref:Uncharacterized protein n=1 Tax=Gracilibacillus thailandensis TaxID=563735 RepID=A0A6N7QW29_9BACI|nr:hypothetical protein [Gracilibacillus thailandensis]MRI65352.1 hypothetical protein [Gracilibacillus thailandensis]